MIPWQDCLHEVAFTHISKDGTVLQIASDRAVKFAEAANLEVVRIPVDPEWARGQAANGTLERHRLDRITLQVIAQLPITAIALDDGTHTIIDGNHRYVKACLLRRSSIRCRIIPLGQWEQFQIELPPFVESYTPEQIRDALAGSFSGIR